MKHPLKKLKTVALVSGGLDSVVALYHIASSEKYAPAVALTFSYGSKHNHREIPCAGWHCRHLGIQHKKMELNFIGQSFKSDLLKSGGEIPDGHYAAETMKQTVVPFRNGIMLAIAAGFAESLDAGGLTIAAHTGDHAIYPDCREEFMTAMNETIRLGTDSNVRLIRPFIAMTKTQIVARGHELGVDFSKTWSCYRGETEHCGKCGTCVERKEAFAKAEIPDPTRYRHE